MQLYYQPQVELKRTVEPDAEESRHLVKVLRGREGDEVWLTNGRGSLFRCTLQLEGRQVQLLPLEEQKVPQHAAPLTLAIAPLKQMERIEWLVEKAVELGVNRIQFIECAHSEKTQVRMERLERIAIAALKQSQRAWLPPLEPVATFEKWVTQPVEGLRFIAHCDKAYQRIPLQEALTAGRPVHIAIGPEGDFSHAEVELALSHGFVGVSLGHSRLRTETAGLAAIHTHALINHW